MDFGNTRYFDLQNEVFELKLKLTLKVKF